MPTAPTLELRRIWLLLAATMCLLLTAGLHLTLTPIYGQILGFDARALGLLGSVYYVGFLAGSLLNPFVFRRLRHRGLICLYAAIVSASLVGQGMLPAYAAWLVLRAMIGFCAAGLYAAIESWLNQIATNANRGRIVSIYTIISQGCLALGQYGFTLFPLSSSGGFFAAATTILVMIVPILALREPQPPAPDHVAIRMRALAAGSPVAFAGFLANGLAIAPFWTLGPVFATEAGFTQGQIGLFMSVPIVASVMTQWPVARYSDGHDRRWVLLFVTIGAALWGLVIAAGTQVGSHLLVYAGIVLFGANAFLINMLASAHMNDRVAPADLTEAIGASYVVYGIASAIGPITASSMMAWLGPAGLFWHTGLVLAVFALFTLTRIVVRAHKPGGTAPKEP